MKLGMTLEGGASRAIFSCGVMDAFLDEGLLPDYLIGVSAGIAFGVSYLSKQKGRNWEITEKYMQDKRYMGMRHLLNRSTRSFYNVDFVFSEIPNSLIPFDYEAFAQYPGEAATVVTNIHSGKAEYLQLPRNSGMNRYLAASCSLPVLFQPMKIGNHYYLDGAIADSIPYEQAVKAGCDKNIVILTRSRDYVKNSDHSTAAACALYRRYPKIVEALKHRAENYNRTVENVYRLAETGDLFIIAPENTHGISRTESDPKKLRKLYDEGCHITQKLLPKLKEYLKS